MRQRVGRRRNGPQQSVDTHADVKRIAHRFDVNIARPKFGRFFEKIIHRADHRRAACQITQTVDVLVGERGVALRSFRRPVLLRSHTFRNYGGNVLERRNRNEKRAAKHDLCAFLRGRIGRVGDGEPKSPFAGLEREDHVFAQKSPSKTISQRRRGNQLR